MLCGEFIEASRGDVELDYSTDVLQAVVDFIYKNEPPRYFLTKFLESSTDSDDAAALQLEPTDEEASVVDKIVSLTDVSEYLELPGLGDEAMDMAVDMIQKKPILSLTYLSKTNDVFLTGSKLEKAAMDCLRGNPKILLQKHAGNNGEVAVVGALSFEYMEKFLKSESINADEFTIFKILHSWSHANNCTDRKIRAQELVRNIDLARIDPSDLKATVKSSELVTTAQLSEVYEKQAILDVWSHIV